MAILKDIHEGSLVSLGIKIRPSKYYSTEGGEWVQADIDYDFSPNGGFKARSEGQECHDIYGFVQEIKDLCSGKQEEITFWPTEPDYEIYIQKHDNSQIKLTIFDDSFTFNGVGYIGAGPGLRLNTNAKDLLKWAEELEKETKIAEFKSKQFGKYK